MWWTHWRCLSCGSRRIIQVDAAHWWWLRRDPPPPHMIWTTIRNKALYKCIIHSFIHSFILTDNLTKYEILWIALKRYNIFSDLLITAAHHHDAVVLRNVSLSSSDKPQHSSSTEIIIKDDKVVLDCTVKANPAPTYTWDLKEKISSSVLNSSTLSPGNYTCTATNYLGNDSKVFTFEGQFWKNTNLPGFPQAVLSSFLILTFLLFKRVLH